MNRILTFAEFAKSFNQKGTDLGNSPKDVEALASSTDQFTADGDGGACDGGEPETIDGDGEKVVALAVKADGEGADDNEEEFDVNGDGEGDADEEEFVNTFDDEDDDADEEGM